MRDIIDGIRDGWRMFLDWEGRTLNAAVRREWRAYAARYKAILIKQGRWPY